MTPGLGLTPGMMTTAGTRPAQVGGPQLARDAQPLQPAQLVSRSGTKARTTRSRRPAMTCRGQRSQLGELYPSQDAVTSPRSLLLPRCATMRGLASHHDLAVAAQRVPPSVNPLQLRLAAAVAVANALASPAVPARLALVQWICCRSL